MKSPKRAFWNKKAKMNMARANNSISITLGFASAYWYVSAYLIHGLAQYYQAWMDSV